MKNKLRALYLLQIFDTELDELRDMRGDLPETVRQLERAAQELQDKIDTYDRALSDGADERTRKEKETVEFLAKIERYKGQQLQVKNNKEYDALTREIEIAESTIIAYEQEIEQFAADVVDIKNRKSQDEEQLQLLQTELSEKRVELEEVLAATEEEERELERKRTEALQYVDVSDLEMYQRIRKAKGKAVTPIRRGSCSGCYNVVPPQLILEIKKNNKFYACEHCGRILISEELAQEASI